MDTLTIQKAAELWDYQSSFASLKKSEVVIVCGSYDLRVCDHACDLIKSGLANKLVLTGNSGNWTKHIWTKTEATIFAERARDNGIDNKQIILETSATNFGENIIFTKKLLPETHSAIFVSKPNSLLRVKLVLEAYWPEVESCVSSPAIHFPQQVSNVVGILGVINEMVGDIDRIQQYPSKGYQASHELPEDILNAFEYLKGQGFTQHLIPADATL